MVKSLDPALSQRAPQINCRRREINLPAHDEINCCQREIDLHTEEDQLL
jgi:hypothetical protein